tara:strand:+ start:594 stop:824 length:231 start_codon:yes stop_codon:yes gene_type:complete
MSSEYNNLYVDPLGNFNENINYNYIDNFKKNKDTINARINDINIKFKSNKYILTSWSIVAGLFILILLMLLRNINN